MHACPHASIACMAAHAYRARRIAAAPLTASARAIPHPIPPPILWQATCGRHVQHVAARLCAPLCAPVQLPPLTTAVSNVPLVCSYEMTKDELLAKISLVDAIVIRSATKARRGCI